MTTLDKIRQPILTQLEEFDHFVARQFTAEGEMLSGMLQYALSSRGKGIRPILVLLAAALHTPEGRSVGRRSHVAATLVEMIHLASLIHDDVIDEADQRRGRPSANALWQSRNAVVLGDYILARNMAIGMQSGQFDLVSHVIGSISTLCEGEILQSEAASKQIASRERYFDIIRRKTAALISVSASVGALSAGASQRDVERMAAFGDAIGIAFQIQDDILDYTLTARTGKPSNNDLREGKITLPLLHVLEHAGEERKAELLERLKRCHDDESEVEYLQTVVEQCGGIAAAEREMEQWVEKGLTLLRDYPQGPYREALELLGDYIIRRNQ